MIVIKDLNKTYKNENISLNVLKNINIHINKG